jgi:hypothetical protein
VRSTYATGNIKELLGPSLTEEQARDIYRQGEEAGTHGPSASAAGANRRPPGTPAAVLPALLAQCRRESFGAIGVRGPASVKQIL